MLVFELGLRGEEPPVTLAERGDRLRGNFLLALQADARAFGEAEDIFGLDLAERAFVGRARGGDARQRECRDKTRAPAARGVTEDSHRTLSIRVVQGLAIKHAAEIRRIIR